jgi:dienelactone hydrolase
MLYAPFMKNLARILISLVAASCSMNALILSQELINFNAADGTQVFAELYSTGNTSQPIVLLFHQANANKAEYSDIAPRLVEAGFNALAVDQRSGGDGYGGENLTVNTLGQSAGYLEALPDLEAALAWATESGYQTILVWGSSYSSSLVFLLTAEHPEIAGVLSFSPGEYFTDATLVQEAATKVSVPVFVTSDGTRGEMRRLGAIFTAVAATDKVLYAPNGIGIHGSSALVQGLLKDEYWSAVLAFLERFK